MIEYGRRFVVACVKYSDYQRAKLAVGQGVKFIGERNNPFDNKAIRIECNGVRIGYVPAGSVLQHGIWSEHARGSHICGTITSYNKNNPTWEMIVVQPLIVRNKLTRKKGEVRFSEMRKELSYV